MATSRTIDKAAVIGAGTMGLGIAGQLANAGVDVVLLDLPASEGERNAIAARALERLLDRNQPGLLHEDLLARMRAMALRTSWAFCLLRWAGKLSSPSAKPAAISSSLGMSGLACTP